MLQTLKRTQAVQPSAGMYQDARQHADLHVASAAYSCICQESAGLQDLLASGGPVQHLVQATVCHLPARTFCSLMVPWGTVQGVKRTAELRDLFASREGDEDALCAICCSGRSVDPNLIVFCERCDIAVHQQCYGVVEIPEGEVVQALWHCCASLDVWDLGKGLQWLQSSATRLCLTLA